MISWYGHYKTASRDLPYAVHQEGDTRFETGKPVSFPFYRNTEKSPQLGPQFQQDIEPHGKYLNHGQPGTQLPKYEYGNVDFRNPLVINWNTNPEGGYDDSGWKAALSRSYGGLKGRDLALAIIKDGYDGIVTVSTWKGKTSTSEIVDLRNFQ